jgi:protein-L-isoaspartate(D-aspartate) O-methyltransferase
MDSSRRILHALLCLATLTLPLACAARDPDSTLHVTAREEMVRSQIIPRGISNARLLAALRRVERHRFVPMWLRAQAYADHPLPIGAGQTISQPYIVALMTELLDLQGDEKVLEIGTGSGYQAAILGELADSVFTIEIIETLAQGAADLLADLGYRNVFVRCGDGYQGWPAQAPFDGIIVTCAPPEIPQPLLDQLADGGRLVIPVGDQWQELILAEKRDGAVVRQRVLPVRFVPMTGSGVEENR